MHKEIRISIDVMGGDRGAEVSIPGAERALRRNPQLRFLLCGNGNEIEPRLNQKPLLRAASEILHTDLAIGMDEKPSHALRRGRHKSSMWLAIDAVKHATTAAAVSAGNTGALTAMARLHLKTMQGVDRPAIAALWPTLKGESIVLDLGASIGTDANHLLQLAIMGGAMARALLEVQYPTVGLLNIGVEEMKGIEAIRDAGRMLREGKSEEFNYVGFVEGHKIGLGVADVVVTEGFAGNIALKVAEGTAHQMVTYMKRALSRGPRGRIGALIAKPSFQFFRDVMDANKRNGGILLGLRGLVVKSHGNATEEGFACAIDIAARAAEYDLATRIEGLLPKYDARRSPGALRKMA